MVELAIALPVLLIVLLGIVEFGRALVYWNDTTQIASVGARWAIVNEWPGKDTQSLQDAIRFEVPAQQGWEGLSDDLDDPSSSWSTRTAMAQTSDVGDAVQRDGGVYVSLDLHAELDRHQRPEDRLDRDDAAGEPS